MDDEETAGQVAWRLLKGLFVILAIIVSLLGSALLWQSRSVGNVNGTVEVSGVGASVSITRDRHAIPHIRGTNDADAFFALGFVHAQDRMWQMELFRRSAQGRLSEIFGERALEQDILFRTLGLGDAAKQAETHLDPDVHNTMEAYAKGVNAFLETRDHPLPIEFFAFQHEPEPWSVADSLSVSKMLAMMLSGNAMDEARQVGLAKILTDLQIAQLTASEEDETVAIPSRQSSTQAATQFARIVDLFGDFEGGASNNWVVSGARSQTGAPLLANDPHLALTVPSIWYLAHLKIGERNIIGATIPGLAAVILGRNDDIAWGFTNTGPDTQDLFIEKINPENPAEYLTPTGWQEFDSHIETIAIRNEDPVEISIRTTRHGPVVPDSGGRFGGLVEPGHVVALAWTALDEKDLTAQAFFKLNMASGWIPFKRALNDFLSPMQSIVYADRRGNIGMMAPGKIPIRSDANEFKGLTPVPGWDGRYDWQGFIPVADLPQAYRPAENYLLTANNKIVPDDYPYMLTARWRPGFRARRIRDLIEQTDKHSLDGFLDMQRDGFSPVAAKLLPEMMHISPDTTATANAISLLRNWNVVMDADRPEPLIYVAWHREFTRALYSDELGEQFDNAWRKRPLFEWNVLTDKDGQSVWCDVQNTLERESCDDILLSSLKTALIDLEGQLGDDIETWRWGDLHKAIHAHRPFDAIPVVRDFFSIETPTHGGSFTLDRANYRMSSERPFANRHAAGYRAVYDLEDLEKSVYVQSTGQSGNVFSRHYADFSRIWAERQYVPMETDPNAYGKSAIGILTLVPQ